MRTKFVLTGSLMAAALIAAACSTTSATKPDVAPSAAPSAAPVIAPTSSPAPPAASGTMINVGATKLGQVLVDSNAQTVYLFLADRAGSSNCNSASCVQYWPPVVTMGAPQAGAGVTASLMGTTMRADGTTQITYNGHPLYRFISDKMAGDVTGQGVNGFGALWYVVSPSGAQIG